MEKINAVEMVRKIRDGHYEQTKDLSRSDYLKFINENGRKALEKIKKSVHKEKISA